MTLAAAEHPAADDLVARPALLARIGRRGVTLLVAPAGYGKTTLLDEWCGAAGRRILRFAADRSVRDLWARLGADAADSADDALARVVNRLDAAGPVAVVLDDVHLLRDGGAEASLARFVELLPPSTILVAAGRTEPALPLPALAAAGRLDVLRVAELRLAPTEVVWLARQVAPAPPTAAQLRDLIHDAEGWPALAYLVAQVLGRGGRPARHVAEYLWEEVVEPLPRCEREFVLCTSALDRLTPRACDALLDRRDSSELLDRLAGRGLVQPFDGALRYQRLLAAVLRDELARRRPALARLLRGRAAEIEARRRLAFDARSARAVGTAAYATGLYLAGRDEQALAAAGWVGVGDARHAPEAVATCFAIRSLASRRLALPAAAHAAARTSVAIAPTALGLLAVATGDRRAAVPTLAEAAARAAGEPAVQAEIRAALASLDGEQPARASSGEPLSAAELRVLRLLAGSLTQREIARELYVSLNTVKTHVCTIYRKLGVRSRDEAVARSRTFNLIPSG